ncbi:hypothetical protein CBR_g25960 [Chara braunii]|uniref:B box-type domain-containing protein n=1 Tax=Chara braunii TaxID=69332 RepID=A0A388L6V6_CHABU|nr:hypothetical protein CBR_g25960 [Chara braunii]|eukprot:GBG78026.1 hypothetical protein CBR_g25960 [Chara braunii]
MCCADEAALCLGCDQRVHDANKLASKHQRVPLYPTGSEEQPKCDICQEVVAFFFCLEDRALLCRECDVSIHTANALAAKHQRFLLTGMRVGLETVQGTSEPLNVPDNRNDSQSSASTSAVIISSAPQAPPIPQNSKAPPQARRGTMPRWAAETAATKANPRAVAAIPNMGKAGRTPRHPGADVSQGVVARPPPPAAVAVAPRKVCPAIAPDAGSPSGYVGTPTSNKRSFDMDQIGDADTAWHMEELLNIPDLPDGYGLADIESGKETESNESEFDWAAGLGLFDEHVIAESLHEVPEMSSQPLLAPSNAVHVQQRTPRVGGLVEKPISAKAGKSRLDPTMTLVPSFDDSFIVPDVSSPLMPCPSSLLSKRRRNCC